MSQDQAGGRALRASTPNDAQYPNQWALPKIAWDQAYGTVAINGSAPSKGAVAAFVDRLAGIRGLAAAFPASVAGSNGQFTFSVNVLLTSDALGGRFALKTSTTGGN